MIDSPATVLAAALGLGLRHAFDPDHLAAILALAGGNTGRAGTRAGRLGLAWGVGHGVTLLALGLPVIWLGPILPPWASRLADAAVGVVLIFLSFRLLLLWRRNAVADRVASSAAQSRRGRGERYPSLRGAFGIGLVHGVGGSAAAGMLLVVSTSSAGMGALAIFAFAAMTAAAMYVLSAALGTTLSANLVARRARQVLPVVALITFAVGLVYVAGIWSA